MKKNISFLILITLLFSACQKDNADTNLNPQFKSYGHEQGNATDNPPLGFADAWVLGDKNKINYCYNLALDFGVDSHIAENEIKAALDVWKTYITAKKINESLESSFHQGHNSSDPVQIEKSKSFHLSINSNLLPHCDGSENIKFYLGYEDSNISALKAAYFNPTAFAHRSQFDSMTGVGQGVIWLAKQKALGPEKGDYPNWSLKNRLRGVLIHELGHFYGVGHIDGTIMQEDMFGLLLSSNWTTENQAAIEYKMSHIDHEKELYYTNVDANEHTYEGQMTVSGLANKTESSTNFELLTGQKPNGLVVAQLYKRKLTLSDGLIKAEFDIKLDDANISNSLPISIFYASRSWPDVGSHLVGSGLTLPHWSSTTIGEIYTITGTTLPLVIEQNTGLAPLRVYTIKNGRKIALMTTNYLSIGL